ncbi:phage protein [Peptoclostridium acidaminophilum DSM 3953]|uniref:Phage protein n=1 Tax=Peptoclostridium acidaminophilum DSM 3953 TaxID=1286171 RepID=W8U668_PEPAC|nr:DUF2634 domain-containing protein [Peptoclostridium acidaminophilum]AHM56416.1 phage protein [Peptoclostridium acidaminophilum DSM 3953]
MADIFPFLDVLETEQGVTQELEMFREYAFDFENGDLIYQDGKPVVLEGSEAMKVWIKKALITKRYRHIIYSWSYGNEFENLIGSTYSRGAVESEAKRYLQECLMSNPWILAIRDVEATFQDAMLSVTAAIDTVYGEVKISV